MTFLEVMIMHILLILRLWKFLFSIFRGVNIVTQIDIISPLLDLLTELNINIINLVFYSIGR